MGSDIAKLLLAGAESALGTPLDIALDVLTVGVGRRLELVDQVLRRSLARCHKAGELLEQGEIEAGEAPRAMADAGHAKCCADSRCLVFIGGLFGCRAEGVLVGRYP
jgi:hypothetical protein